MLPPDTFLGRVAVVTGGGTGLGRAIAIELARLGADVVVTSRALEHIDPVASEIRALGRRALAVACDVREVDQVRAVVRATREAFAKVDVLVNNAAGNFVCPAEAMSPNAWRSVLGIVLDGTFYCSRFFGEAMIEQKSGAILNVGATYAWTGGPGTMHSACAKAGVHTMTKTLAVEWARFGIRVNCLVPGPILTEGASSKLFPTPEVQKLATDHVPLRRFGTAEEMARLAALLCSDYASYVTGEIFVADGGSWLDAGYLEMLDRAQRGG